MNCLELRNLTLGDIFKIPDYGNFTYEVMAFNGNYAVAREINYGFEETFSKSTFIVSVVESSIFV